MANCPGVVVADLRADYDARPLATDGTPATNLPAGREGRWSYGASPDMNPVAGGFDPLEFTSNSGLSNVHLNSWLYPAGTNALPGIHNVNVIEPGATEGTAGAGEATVHPGNGSSFFVARWTAATTGSVTLRGHAQDIGAVCTGVTLAVYVNGASVFGPVDSTGNVVSFDLNTTVNAGNHVDFVVGNRDGDFGCDQTALAATVLKDATTCIQRACVNNQCGYTFASAGTPVPTSEVAGDCRAAQCDGNGNILQAVDVNDLPVDGNGCTQDLCSASGNPSNPSEPSGTQCTTGGGRFCNSTGNCVECVTASQCTSLVCNAAGQCALASCTDNVTNGTESDTDCGGSVCPPCSTGDTCLVPGDCQSGVCTGSTCQAAGCGDGVINNAGETCDDGNTNSGDGCSTSCTVETGFTCLGSPSVCATTCGDGIRSGAEACDDNNTAGGDGCTSSCIVELGFVCTGTQPSVCSSVCGDGRVVGGETCDDSGTTGGDGCSSTCALETGYVCAGQPSTCTTVCGDGFIRGGETCDDGDLTGGNGCNATCAVEFGFTCLLEPSLCTTTCGDGLKASVEACDDANVTTGDGCDSSCVVQPGFTCTGTAPSVCNTTCGDGIRAGAEACDDNNTTTGDGCTGACTVEAGFTCAGSTPSVCTATCGDGIRASTEACDDGNVTSGDGCSTACAVEAGFTCVGSTPSVCSTTCGDGIRAGSESCDDNNVTSGDGCTASCSVEAGYNCSGDTPSVCVTVCGDGIVAGAETCDDTGTDSFDGCSATCAVEAGYTCSGAPSACSAICGDTLVRGAEQCDDGNLNPLDGCSPTCQLECGNNTLNPALEQCDDGNRNAGDGCSPTCTFEVNCGPFETLVQLNSADVPKSIPDNNLTGVDSVVSTSPTLVGQVRSVMVGLGRINHTYDGDLRLSLVGPTGLSRNLVLNRGSSGQNFVNTRLFDAATSPISAGAAPFNAGYRPEQTLSDLAGFRVLNAAGNWTLRAVDSASGDVGTLVGWTLSLCVDTYASCGNGGPDYDEECDDGDTNDLNTCSNRCQLNDGCGDGNVDPGEQCDDDNLVGGDGCSVTCTLEFGCSSGDVPVVLTSNPAAAIPDNNTFANFPINVALTGGVTRAMVFIQDITHANTGHLDIQLQSPLGTVRNLSDDNGAGANYRSTRMEDAAVTLVTAGSSPFTGSFRPEATLSTTLNVDFREQNAAGTWNLQVRDDTTGIAGVLNGWALGLCVNPGAYCGDGLLNGTEECDTGGASVTCTAGCQLLEGCGDGNLDAGEECDDNNVVSGDGCSSTCVLDISCGPGETPVVLRNTTAAPIPDNPAGLASTITVPVPGAVRRVIPTVNISHANNGHMEIFLTSPFGVQRELSTDQGGVNYVATSFSDAAAAAIISSAAPFTGTFRPEQTISNAAGFANQQAAGNWILRAGDDTAGTAGTLNSWALALCVDTSTGPVCGNGFVEPGEQCDDGNTNNGDGCASCALQVTCPGGSLAVFTSADVPKLIQDNVPAGVNSVIDVANAGTVTKAVVVLRSVTHQFAGDLALSLITPSTVAVDLTSGNGSSGDDFVSTILDDAGTSSIVGVPVASAPFRGRYRPETSLGPAVGQAAAGTWTLRAADTVNGDAGMLMQWSLGLCIQ